VTNFSLPETEIVEENSNHVVYALKATSDRIDKDQVLCGARIIPWLYALDVFVPVLDLKQQSVCSFAADRQGWRYAQAAYAVLGWILTPLMFLTVTGLLKRHIEK
jgi:hypothetical protein